MIRQCVSVVEGGSKAVLGMTSQTLEATLRLSAKLSQNSIDYCWRRMQSETYIL